MVEFKMTAGETAQMNTDVNCMMSVKNENVNQKSMTTEEMERWLQDDEFQDFKAIAVNRNYSTTTTDEVRINQSINEQENKTESIKEEKQEAKEDSKQEIQENINEDKSEEAEEKRSEVAEEVIDFCTNMMPQTLPTMDQLPTMFKKLCVNEPSRLWIPTAKSIFTALAAYTYKITFKTLSGGNDGNFILMHFLVALPGRGKSRAFKPAKVIVAELEKKAEEIYKEIRQWMKETNEASRNSKKKARPEKVLQIVLPNTTEAALIDIMENAQGYLLYIATEEITDFKLFPLIELLKHSFYNEIYGATRYSLEGSNGYIVVRILFNVAAQPENFEKHFGKEAFDGGAYTRVSISCLRDGYRKEDKVNDAGYESEEYISYVNGLISNIKSKAEQEIAVPKKIDVFCEQLLEGVIEAKELCVIHKGLIEACGQRQVEIERRRMMLHYIAMGCDESILDETFFNFHLTLFFDDIYNKAQYFSKYLASSHEVGQTPKKDNSCLEKMSDTFTLQDLINLYGNDLSEKEKQKKARNLKDQWIHKFHIEETNSGMYKKLHLPYDDRKRLMNERKASNSR